MRELQEQNDLFFTCSLIEYIARITNNEKSYIINKLTKEKIKKIYKLASVYHSENIESVANSFIKECNIEKGNYNLMDKYSKIPTYFEIGRVYTNLITMINNDPSKYIDTLVEVLSSWIIKHIDNYNSSLYYETPSYIYECYKEGKII